jgi:hypothetical protein
MLESLRSVPVLDRGDLAGDLVTDKADKASNPPVQLLDLRRLADQSAPGQLPRDWALAGRTLPGQKRLQLRHPVESLLKVNRTSGRRRMVSLSVEFQAINEQE